MLTFRNMIKFFIVVCLIAVVPTLCMADGKKHHGTRANTGAYSILNGSTLLNLIVFYVNPSNSPITIKEIKIFRPDGTKVTPDFSNANIPQPPFDLGPYESKGFALAEIDTTQIPRETWPPITGLFQVHTDWESDRATNGLKGHSVVITVQSSGVVSKIAVEGFDIKVKKPKDGGGGGCRSRRYLTICCDSPCDGQSDQIFVGRSIGVRRHHPLTAVSITKIPTVDLSRFRTAAVK